MLVDYHIHTPLCAHAEGEPAEYVERAIALGIAEIGFCEHSPWKIQRPGEKLAPDDEEFAQLVRTVASLQHRYGETPSGPIRVRLSIEMDYVPDRLDRVRDYLDKYPWDYLVGSIHHLDQWGIDHPDYVAEYERRDIAKLYEEYFATVGDLAETGLFDVVGHVDVIKKFGYRPACDLRPLYGHMASVFRRADVVVELNTSGRDKEAGEFYPAPSFVAALAAEKVPFTLGSDAHHPNEVGRHFAEARAMLLDLGVGEIVAFEKRRRRFVPL